MRELLEARIVPERIEHRIEAKQRRSKRSGPTLGRHRQQLFQGANRAIRLAHLRADATQYLKLKRANERIFLDWHERYGTLDKGNRRRFVLLECGYQRKIVD
jgi:hypothetical protein